jgi:uncharacterized caspase-like protein
VSYFGQYPSLRGFYKNMWALVVGIDRYQDSSIPKLGFAVNDARAVESLIREKLVAGQVFALYNEEATRENICKILQKKLTEAGPDDAVLLYFACHGTTFPTGGKPLGDIVPYDGSQEDRYRNISMQTFKNDIARAIPARHLMLVVDACYGGLLTTRSMVINPLPGHHEDRYLQEIKGREAKIVLTAGKEDEKVLDMGGQGHSAFTNRLIETVEGARYFIAAKELYAQIHEKVQEDAAQYGHTQTPQFGFWGRDDGDFVLIKK